MDLPTPLAPVISSSTPATIANRRTDAGSPGCPGRAASRSPRVGDSAAVLRDARAVTEAGLGGRDADRTDGAAAGYASHACGAASQAITPAPGGRASPGSTGGLLGHGPARASTPSVAAGARVRSRAGFAGAGADGGDVPVGSRSGPGGVSKHCRRAPAGRGPRLERARRASPAAPRRRPRHSRRLRPSPRRSSRPSAHAARARDRCWRAGE